jgi:hypothetical protein
MLLIVGYLALQTVPTVLVNGARPDAPACTFPSVPSSQTLVLPPDGRIECQSITIPSGVTVTFTRNALNTPVYLLSRGPVVIRGTLDVDGRASVTTDGGLGGPGGFDGGASGLGLGPGGNGGGPGGGIWGQNGSLVQRIASGSFGTRYDTSVLSSTYGLPSLFPLIGGSGGAGNFGAAATGNGGGGGGGAILIASEVSIEIAGGVVSARGGSHTGESGNGSGGAIRLVAPSVTNTGTLRAQGGNSGNAGAGRIRIDSIVRSIGTANPTPSLGTNLIVALDAPPRLDLISVAGIATNGAPFVQMLPVGSPASQPVVISAQDFAACVDVDVYVRPERGTTTKTTLPCQPNGTITTNVTIPSNVTVSVEVFGTPSTPAQ